MRTSALRLGQKGKEIRWNGFLSRVTCLVFGNLYKTMQGEKLPLSAKGMSVLRFPLPNSLACKVAIASRDQILWPLVLTALFIRLCLPGRHHRLIPMRRCFLFEKMFSPVGANSKWYKAVNLLRLWRLSLASPQRSPSI